jgi:hypothetical protein
MAVFKYASMSVSLLLSYAAICAPGEAPAAVCCDGIGWGISMPPMQLQQNTRHQALLQILYQDVNDNIINSMIHYDGLRK